MVNLKKRFEKGEAAHRFTLLRREFYQVNELVDTSLEKTKGPYDLERLLGIAIHEVRHRCQGVPLPFKKELIELFDKENLKENLKDFKDQYLKEIAEKMEEIYDRISKVEKRPRSKKREFDAEIVEQIALGLYKKGIPLSEICKKVISKDAREILSFLKENL